MALAQIKNSLQKCMFDLPQYVAIHVSVSPIHRSSGHNVVSGLIAYLRNISPDLEIHSTNDTKNTSSVKILVQAKESQNILTLPPIIYIGDCGYCLKTYTPGLYKTSIQGLPEMILSNTEFLKAILRSIGDYEDPLAKGRISIPIPRGRNVLGNKNFVDEKENNTLIALFKSKPKCFSEKDKVMIEVNNIQITLTLLSDHPPEDNV